MVHNILQGQETKKKRRISSLVSALVFFVIYVGSLFVFSSCGSDSGSNLVHQGLYDDGYSYGKICRSYGKRMTVEDAWNDMTYGRYDMPDSPTPEFTQGFKDGLKGKVNE